MFFFLSWFVVAWMCGCTLGSVGEHQQLHIQPMAKQVRACVCV